MPGNPTVTRSNCGICPAISCSTPTKRSGGKGYGVLIHPRREQFALGVEHRPLIPEPPQSRLSVRMGYRLPEAPARRLFVARSGRRVGGGLVAGPAYARH